MKLATLISQTVIGIVCGALLIWALLWGISDRILWIIARSLTGVLIIIVGCILLYLAFTTLWKENVKFYNKIISKNSCITPLVIIVMAIALLIGAGSFGLNYLTPKEITQVQRVVWPEIDGVPAVVCDISTEIFVFHTLEMSDR